MVQEHRVNISVPKGGTQQYERTVAKKDQPGQTGSRGAPSAASGVQDGEM